MSSSTIVTHFTLVNHQSLFHILIQYKTIDFTWGYFEYYMDLEKSSVPAYQRLFRQAFQEKDPSDKLRNIRQNPKYGVYTEVIFGRFLAAIQTVLDDALNMRLMKSCLYNHWTTFALQKNSPYTEYFNEKIAMYTNRLYR